MRSRTAAFRRLLAAGFIVSILASTSGRALGDDVLVAGFSSSSVNQYRTDGGLEGVWVSSGDGGLVGAHSIRVGPEADIYVTSFNTGEVLRFDGATGDFVEVFANGKQCVAMRDYPSREDSLGVSLRAQGGDAELNLLSAWQMENIYE